MVLSLETFALILKLKSEFKRILIKVKDLIVDLNGEFKDRGGENFDFKKTYKSSNLLKALTNEVLKAHKKLINRGRVESFSQLMNQQ